MIPYIPIGYPVRIFEKKGALDPFFAENPIWRPSAWYGHTNFFSMGDNSKILFHSIGFPYPSNSKKQFLSSLGVPTGPWGPFGSFLGKNAYFGTSLQKIKMFYLFNTCFCPVRHKNIIAIQRKKLQTTISQKGLQKL